MNRLKCLKCYHEWIPRIIKRPLCCPSCKIRTWDTEEYSSCETCNRRFLVIIRHHKDGDEKNDDKSNIIYICCDCHSVIHNGLRNKDRLTLNGKTTSSRMRKYKNKPEIIKKLMELRKYWLSSKSKVIL